MKILVTGGAGFIGSHVVDRYIELGHEVFVLDDLSHGKEKNLNPEAKFVKMDIRERDALGRLFGREKFDVVNHHAAQINVRKSTEDPVLDAEVNIIGSLNLIRLSIEHKVRRFIFASTGGALYGEPEKLPVSEDHPKRPISQYGLAKWTVEQYLFLAHQQSGLEYVALRYGNVYGPRQDAEGEAGVIAIFIDRLKRGERPVIFGDGEQTRDYVYVGDVAGASGRALAMDMSKLNVGGTELAPDSFAIHIGLGEEVTVNTLLGQLNTIAQKNIEPIFQSERMGEVRRISLLQKRAADLLGIKGFTSLRKGLEKTVESIG